MTGALPFASRIRTEPRFSQAGHLEYQGNHFFFSVSLQSKTVLMKCFRVDQPGEETSDNHGTF